jgi:hypothetical protein
MDNFDLRKFLAEGKLYKENLMGTRSEAEQDAQIFHKDLVVKYGFDNVADALEALYDNAEEGGASYENIADLLKMDNSMLTDMITSNLAEGKEKPTKIKMSELKAKIRTEILAELTLNEDDDIDFGIGGEETQADVDFYEGLEEATKDGDGEVPSKDTDTDIDIEDKEEVDVDVEDKPKVSGVDGEFLDQLEDLKDEADAIGDNKLERQIDNTITYFTRQHIAKDTNESLELEEDFGPAVQSTDPKAREIEKKIQDNPELQKQIAQIMAQAQKGGDTSKLLGMMTGLFEADELEEADDMALVADLEADLKEGYSEFQRVGKGKKKTVARNKGEEEVYGAGVKKGEEIEKKKLKETMKESLEILKMKKLAGLLSEGEYAKALLREMEETSEDEVPFTNGVKKFIDKAVADAKADGEFKYLLNAGWFDNELIDELIDLFPDKDYDRASQKVKDYISQSISLKEMEEDVFDYSNLVLGTINRLIDMEEKGQSVLNILGRISEWNEVVDLAREEEGDSFDYSNLVLGTINQLINMGEKGQSVLNILGRISEWNEVVDLAREA